MTLNSLRVIQGALLATVAPVLAACQPPATSQGASFYTPATISRPSAPHVRVADDRYRPVIEYIVEPSIQAGQVNVNFGGAKYREGGRKTYDAVVGVVYNGSTWARYGSARDEQARSLSTRVVDRDVRCSGSRYGGCTYSEILTVGLEESSLRQAAQAGTPYRFKVFGGTGDFEVSIPPDYIRALFQEMGTPLQATAAPARRSERRQ